MKKQIQALIAKGRTAEALEALAPFSSEVILLQARLSSLSKENRMGIINGADYRIGLSKINYAVLSLLDDIDFTKEKESTDMPNQSPPNTDAGRSVPPKKSVFFSYAHEDKALQQRLHTHLAPLRRSERISVWTDEEIKPGAEWDATIKARLHSADIILLLVSADFIASDYIWETELKTAMQRHAEGSATVVPIILKPCQWQDMPFGKLQALPTGAKPVTDWPDQDSALNDVAEGIRRLI